MAFEAINVQDISGSQVIKIPENFKINDDKVYLKKVGNALCILPFHNPWQSMVDSLWMIANNRVNNPGNPFNR